MIVVEPVTYCDITCCHAQLIGSTDIPPSTNTNCTKHHAHAELVQAVVFLRPFHLPASYWKESTSASKGLLL